MSQAQVTRQYALTYLLAGAMTQHQADESKVKVEAILSKHKAKVLKTDEWGKKPLAYIIAHDGKKHKEAYYYHLIFSLESLTAPVLERDVYLMPEIIRHLMVVDTTDTKAEAPLSTKVE